MRSRMKNKQDTRQLHQCGCNSHTAFRLIYLITTNYQVSFQLLSQLPNAKFNYQPKSTTNYKVNYQLQNQLPKFSSKKRMAGWAKKFRQLVVGSQQLVVSSWQLTFFETVVEKEIRTGLQNNWEFYWDVFPNSQPYNMTKNQS